MYFFLLVFVILAVVGTMNLVRSRIGRAFIAIRDHDVAAEIIGIDIFRYKLLAFAISSFYAGVTGVLYTLPSLAVFFLLLPITGRGNTTALIALTAYTLQIIFRNIVTGLENVPAEARDAGIGMGLTDRQLLWRVELPLALPDVIAGLRIATTTTVGLATLAVFAGAGGLGEQIVTGSNITFKTGVVAAGGLAVLLALALDMVLLGVQRVLTPWRRARPA